MLSQCVAVPMCSQFPRATLHRLRFIHYDREHRYVWPTNIFHHKKTDLHPRLRDFFVNYRKKKKTKKSEINRRIWHRKSKFHTKYSLLLQLNGFIHQFFHSDDVLVRGVVHCVGLPAVLKVVAEHVGPAVLKFRALFRGH